MNFKDSTLLRQAALVGRDWIEVRSDNAIAVNNPATGEVIGSVPDQGSIETKRAIAAAEVAQKEWAAHTAKERSAILRRWFERGDLVGSLAGWYCPAMAPRYSCNDPS
jgi:succinate-semialdehyde dehydrogenase / glutarate-semialdehyde dehydrogenase